MMESVSKEKGTYKSKGIQVRDVNVPPQGKSRLDLLHVRLRKAFRLISSDLENIKTKTAKDFLNIKAAMKNELATLQKDVYGKQKQDNNKLLIYFDNYKKVVDKDLSDLKLKEKQVLEALQVSTNLQTLKKNFERLEKATEKAAGSFVKADDYNKTVKNLKGELDKKSLSRVEIRELEKDMSSLKRDLAKLNKVHNSVENLDKALQKVRANSLTRYNFDKQARWIKEIEKDVLDLVSLKTKVDQLASVKEVRDLRSEFDEAMASHEKSRQQFKDVRSEWEKNRKELQKFIGEVSTKHEGLRRETSDYRKSSEKLFQKATSQMRKDLSNTKSSLLSEVNDLDRKHSNTFKELSRLSKSHDSSNKDVETLKSEIEEMKSNLLLMQKTVGVQQRNIDRLNKKEGLPKTPKLPKLAIKKKKATKKKKGKSEKSDKKNVAKKIYDWLMEDEDQD